MFILTLLQNLFLFLGYIANPNSFPKPLSPSEEAEYLRQMQEGDKKARDILMERNLRLVAHVVKKYTGNQYDNADLISIGTIGLIKGINTFKPDKNIRLATYCARCIENEILMVIRSEKKLKNEVSLYDSVKGDGAGGDIRFMDILENQDDIDLLDHIELRSDVTKLYSVLGKTLSAREIEVLKMRYGLFNTPVKTQRQIADQLKISRSYVSRIEKKAITKLQKLFDTN